MENSVTLRPEGRRIFIKGTITQEAIEPIREAMTTNSIFCLDFSEVEGVNFAAMRGFLNLRKMGLPISIVNASDAVTEKFEDSGLSTFISICRKAKPLDMSVYEEFGESFMSKAYNSADGDAMIKVYGKHGSLEIRYRGLSIQIDPVTKLGERVTDYAAEFPKADFIFVTHEHFDHCDKDAITALSVKKTQLVTNARCAEMLGHGTVMANGDSADLAEDIHLDAVPAYNTTEGHLQFHPKGRDNGFVLTIDGLRIYVAGDTEDIPEMAEIKDVDVAFLPVNQPYTMTPDQCIRAAKVLQPKVLIPYHYGNTDLSEVPAALPGIDVRIRRMQ